MQRGFKTLAAVGLSTLMGLSMVGSAVAQPPGGGGGQGRGGRGGFGGGMMMGGGTTSIFTALRAESVQKELAVTEEQKTKLTTLAEEVRNASRDLFPMGAFGGGGGERPSREEMEKTMAEVRAKTDKLIAEKKPQLAAILSAEQMTRLEEIVLQAKGAEALNDAEIQAKLMINDDQKAKLAAVSKEFGDKMRELGGFGGGRGPGGGGAGGPGGGGEGFREAMEKRQAMGKERDAALVAVLTPVQQEQFDLMKGKEFDVASLRGGFGGRGPGGPGGGGPGGRGGDRPNRPAGDN